MKRGRRARIRAFEWLSACALAACSGGSSAAPDSDAVAHVDVGSENTSPDVGVLLPRCAPPGQPPDPVALGLPIAAPVARHLVCQGNLPGFEPMETDQPDVNWVCTFDHDGTYGVLYLPAKAVDCHWDLGTATDYETSGALLAACGRLVEVASSHYDWGGNHHNDFLEFVAEGRRYRFFHSSFDYKWRQCQPPDCLQVYDAAGDVLLQDGCKRERALPVTCVKVGSDGAVPPLVDTFVRCPGDG